MPKKEKKAEASIETLMQFNDRALVVAKEIAGDTSMTAEREKRYEEQLAALEREAERLGIA